MKISKIVLMGIILFFAFLMLMIFSSKNTSVSGYLPAFAAKNQKIQEAYTFAKNSGEKLDGVPCFCGCMQHMHNGRIHSRGLLDCFMEEDNKTFEDHASNCDMCINDALEVKTLSAQGLSKDAIKQKISSKYIN
ncbi:MAG: PCYCGC motif-containing (lipo)protein [Candidatus Diapherotrites archaeon]